MSIHEPDHPNLPFVVDSNGIPRYLGHHPQPRMMSMYSPMFGTDDLIPESKWEEFEDPLPPGFTIKDQDGKGACNGHAAATSLELARYVEGLDYVELSAWFIYSILCNGIDMGSSIGSALQLIQDQGCCPDTEVPYATINPRKLSDQAHTDAARFKATIAGALTSPEAVMTAVQRRIPINASICVGARFNNVDSNGIAPEGWGWDNHAIAHWGGAKKVNGVWYVKFINSWTAQWGINGCAWRRLDTCRGGSFEAYGVLAVMFDPEAQNNPPIIKVA